MSTSGIITSGARRGTCGAFLGWCAAVLLVAVLFGLALGCSGGSATTITGASSSTPSSLAGTSSSGPDSGTAVTHIASDADFRWSPAEALSSEDADAIASFLGLAVVYPDGLQCGYVDTTGAYAIEPRSTQGEFFSDGLALVAVEAGDRYIGKTGAYAFDTDRPQVVWALIDPTGQIVWRLEQ
jgi:hypothetical protein